MQDDDGNIIDGYIPKEESRGNCDYIYSELAPRYAGHKYTVETDQESSLVRSGYKNVKATDDDSILDKKGGK